MPPALGNVTFRNPNSHVPVAQQPQQLPAMERQSVERLGERQFLNHRNIQVTESFANLFHRVHANEADMRHEAPNFASRFQYNTSDDGRLTANLRPAQQGGVFRKEVKDGEQAYEAFRQEVRGANDLAREGMSTWQKFLSFVKRPFQSREHLRITAAEQQDPAAALIQPNDNAPQAPKFQTTAQTLSVGTDASRPQEGTQVEVQRDYKDTVKSSTFWRKLGFGIAVGVAAAALIGAAVVFAPALLGGSLIAAVGLGIAAPLLASKLVLANMNSPWWSQTVNGKIQHEERRQAHEIGNAFATMVKDQVVREHLHIDNGVQMPAGSGPLEKVGLLELDPAKLNDFLKLAKEQSPTNLKSAVKEWLLSDNSYLDQTTRDYAKRTVAGDVLRTLNPFKGWAPFSNEQRGHAQSTVNKATEAIADGIMRGVGEGALQLLEVGISDQKSQAAQRILKQEIIQKPVADFEGAVSYLASANAGPKDLAPQRLAEHEDRYRSYKTSSALAQQHLRAAENIIGTTNLQSYVGALQQLDQDVDVQLASVVHLRSLVDGDGQDGKASLRQVNTQIERLLQGDQNADGIEAVSTQAKTLLDAVHERLVDVNETPNLIAAHAEMVRDAVTQMRTAVDSATRLALATENAGQAFTHAQVPPTREIIQAQLSALEASESSHQNLDVLGTLSNEAFEGMNVRMGELKEACKNILQAYERADSLKAHQAESVLSARSAQTVDALKQALSADAQAGLGKTRLLATEQRQQAQAWTQLQWRGEPYQHPADMAYATAEQDWQVAVAAAATGADQAEADIAAQARDVLIRLADASHAQVLLNIHGKPPAQAAQLLNSLQNIHSAEPSPGEALKAYAAGREVLGPKGKQALQLAGALYPTHLVLLNKADSFANAEITLADLARQDKGIAASLRTWARETDEASADVTEAATRLMQPSQNLRQPAKDLLTLLNAFQQKHPQDLDNATPEAIQHTLQAMDRVQFDQPETLSALDQNKLDLMHKLEQTLSERLPSQVEQAIAVAKMRAEAARQVALEIAPNERIQNGVALKNEADKVQFLAQGREVAQNQKAIDDQVHAININQFDLSKHVTELRGLLNLDDKVTDDEIVGMVSRDAELTQQVRLLFNAAAALKLGVEPVQLTHSFTPEELLKGAKQIAQLATIPILPVVPETAKKRFEQTNILIGKFKDKTDLELGKLLKIAATKQFVEDFLREERALQALRDVSGARENESAQQYRITIEGRAEAHIEIRANLDMTRDVRLSEEKLKLVQQNLNALYAPSQQVLENMLGAKAGSHEGAPPLFDGANSTYLQAQLDTLKQKIGTPEQLAQAYRNASTGTLAEVGAKLLDGDKLNEATQADIQRTYIQGQHDTLKSSLKYLNVKTLINRRPGLIGRVLFRVMGRHKRLGNFLQNSDTAQISKSLAGVSTLSQNGKLLQQQFDALKQQMTAQIDKRNAFIKDANVLKAAYIRAAVEHLEGKLQANPQATLSQADLEQVLGKWKALLGVDDETLPAFADIQREIDGLAGKGLAHLIGLMAPKDQEKVNELFNEMEALDQDITKQHQALAKAIRSYKADDAKILTELGLEHLALSNSTDAIARANRSFDAASKSLSGKPANLSDALAYANQGRQLLDMAASMVREEALWVDLDNADDVQDIVADSGLDQAVDEALLDPDDLVDNAIALNTTDALIQLQKLAHSERAKAIDAWANRREVEFLTAMPKPPNAAPLVDKLFNYSDAMATAPLLKDIRENASAVSKGKTRDDVRDKIKPLSENIAKLTKLYKIDASPNERAASAKVYVELAKGLYEVNRYKSTLSSDQTRYLSDPKLGYKKEKEAAKNLTESLSKDKLLSSDEKKEMAALLKKYSNLP